ncbi:MAG: DUF370 domain-containing protein [Oscillospiraceae bacterium]
MYIDIATDFLINSKEVIGIFDLDNTTVNQFTRDYLNSKQKENKLIYLIKDLPKSFILVTDGTVYVVELSSQVLRKRLEII